MWDEITYPHPKFNGCTVVVWKWISNFVLSRYDISKYLPILGLWLIRLVKEVLHCNGQSHWVSPGTREVDEISWGKSNISLYTLFVISCWRIRCSPTRLLRQNIGFLFVFTNELPMSIHKHGMRTLFSILSALQRVNDSWFHSEWGKFSKRHERVCFIQ